MRILIYSHDTYGLGHFRRSLIAAENLVSRPEVDEVLIVTGSPRAGAFEMLPQVKIFSLPAVLKQADGSYRSRDNNLDIEVVINIRAHLIEEVWESFRPDILLVDHAPTGVMNELQPLFSAIEKSQRTTRCVLGLRDILDDSEKVAADWKSQDVERVLEDVYDDIVVYGVRGLGTTAESLGLDEASRFPKIAPKLSFVGFMARRPMPSSEAGRWLVTTGGGGDGKRLLKSVLGYLKRRRTPLDGGIDIVLGPFLSPRRTRAIKELAASLPQDVQLIEFEAGLEDRIASARGVIAMAGYNTVVEVLTAQRPALFVPRESPRLEQTLRCRHLEKHMGLRWRPWSDLNDQDFDEFFSEPAPPRYRTAASMFEGGQRLADLVCRSSPARPELDPESTAALPSEECH